MTVPQILATVTALRAAQTPEAAQAVLLDAIDQGLPIVLAANTWREWHAEAARTVTVLEASA
jgi:hypothetical protein